MEEKETGFRNSVAEKGHSSSYGLAIFYPLDQMMVTNMPSCQGPSYQRRKREDGCGEERKGG